MLKLAALLIAVALTTGALGDIIPFDDIPLAPESFCNGSDGAGGFVSGGASFNNNYTNYGGGFFGWNGWSVSNTTNNVTPGFTNQFSAYTGGGHMSANYGVAYGNSARITFPVPSTVNGGYFTNTTYAALSMLLGDFFNDPFGGDDGTEPDWFYVRFTGLDENGNSTGNVTFYLADYRFEDNSLDYIVDTWTWVDLSSLGLVKQIRLSFDGSNFNQYGLTIPTYVAADNIDYTPIPEPAALLLLAACGLAIRRRH